MRDCDRESRSFFRTRLWLDTPRCIELFGQETDSRRAFSVCGVLHQSCNLRERGEVLKSTLVVDNDTTVHDVHRNISPDQMLYLSLSSDTDGHSVNGSRKTIRGI